MQGVYLNEIPVDLFLKYFDENTVDKTDMTPVMENLKSNVITIKLVNLNTEEESYINIPNGTIDMSMISSMTGFSTYTKTVNNPDELTFENIAVSSNTTISITIDAEKQTDENTIIIKNILIDGDELDISDSSESERTLDLTKTNVFTKDVTLEGLNSISIAVMTSSNNTITFMLDDSANNILWGLDNIGPFLIDGFGRTSYKNEIYYAPSNSGLSITTYAYTLELADDSGNFYKFIGADCDDSSYTDENNGITIYLDRNPLAICDLLDKTSIENVTKADELYLDEFTYYTCNMLLDNGIHITNIIKNEPAQVQAMTNSGTFLYRDKLGYIAFGDSTKSNLSKQRDALRETFYDISSMDLAVGSKLSENQLGYVQKGTNINLVHYTTYEKQEIYKLLKNTTEYDRTDILSPNIISNAENNALIVSDTEYKNIETLLDSEDLDTVKAYCAKYVDPTTKTVNIVLNSGTNVTMDTPYFMDLYLRKCKVFSDSTEEILPLSCRIDLDVKTYPKEDTTSKSSVDLSSVSSVIGAVGSVLQSIINSPGNKTEQKASTTSTINIEMDGSSYSISEKDNIQKLHCSSMKIYNTELSPYILFPVYIKNSSIIKDKADATTGCVYLTMSFPESSDKFSLYYSGGQYFIADEKDNSKNIAYLYTMERIGSRNIDITYDVSDTSIKKEDIYFCELPIESLTEVSASSDKIIGVISRGTGEYNPRNAKITTKRKSKYTLTKLVTECQYVVKPISFSGDYTDVADSDFPESYIKNAVEYSFSSNPATIEKYIDALISSSNFQDISSPIKVVLSGNQDKNYYIVKESIRDVKDMTKVYAHLTIYSCNKDLSYQVDVPYISFSQIIKAIPGVLDNYYPGRSNSVDENVYYNKKKSAITEMLENIIDNPYDANVNIIDDISGYTANGDGNINKAVAINKWIYGNSTGASNGMDVYASGGTSVSSLLSGMNMFDKERTYAGGLYTFVNNDGAADILQSIDIRDMTNIDDFMPIVKLTKYKSTPNVDVLEKQVGLTTDAANEIENMTPFKHLIMYKTYPTINDYYTSLQAQSEAEKAIDMTTGTTMINNDNTPVEIKNNGEVVYRKYNKDIINRNTKEDFIQPALSALLSYGLTEKYLAYPDKDVNKYRSTFDNILEKIQASEAYNDDSFTNTEVYAKKSFSSYSTDIDNIISTVLSERNNDIKWRVL